MGIEIRPKNEAQVYAKTGALIGQAQRRAQEWELEKAEARSQLDFQQELRLRQLDDERVIKAREWELEKMMIRSRLDFEAEEKERLQKKQQFQAVMKQIDETDMLTPEKKELAKFQTAMKFQGVDIADEILSPKEETERYGVMPHWMRPDVLQTPYGQAQLTKSMLMKPEPEAVKRTDVDAAIKGIQTYNERYGGVLNKLPLIGNAPSPEEQAAYEYYKNILNEAGLPTEDTQTEPIPVATEDEYNDLPVGVRYVDPQGNMRTKQ